jgi:hypothetical protein
MFLKWHEKHDEFFEVLQGVGRLTLEDASEALGYHFVAPGSGVVHIPRYRRHCLGRGDMGYPPSPQLERNVVFVGEGKGDDAEWERDLLVREFSEPRDGEKEVFFRNLAGVVNESKPEYLQNGNWLLLCIWGWWVEWQVWFVGAEGDNFPAVLGGWGGRLEWVAVHVICWFVVILGRVVGLEGRYDEYTPVELRRGNVSRKMK